MKSSAVQWTRQEVRSLIAFSKKDITKSTIAQKLGRTVAAVESKLVALGIEINDAATPATQNPSEVLDVRYLQQQGHSIYPVKGGYCINGHIKTADAMKEMAARIKRNQEILSR